MNSARVFRWSVCCFARFRPKPESVDVLFKTSSVEFYEKHVRWKQLYCVPARPLANQQHVARDSVKVSAKTFAIGIYIYIWNFSWQSWQPPKKILKKLWAVYLWRQSLHYYRVLISPQPNEERKKLQRPNSNICKPLKKNSESCPSNQVSAETITSASDEKWRTFNCFFSRVGLRTYQHPSNSFLFK